MDMPRTVGRACRQCARVAFAHWYRYVIDVLQSAALSYLHKRIEEVCHDESVASTHLRHVLAVNTELATRLQQTRSRQVLTTLILQ